MASALETLCGQAVGARQLDRLGIYMQRSWIITGATALALTPVYALASPILKGLKQPNKIAEATGRYCIWVIPQLFAYALNFPFQKFFQSQSKVWAMVAISGSVLCFHTILTWLFVMRLRLGLPGAAIAGNISWWCLNAAQFLYLVSGCFRNVWTGFSTRAFQSLAAFVKLSLASAVMLCMELWYFTAVIILVGCLHHPQLQVSAISICLNYQIWTMMMSLGFNAAVSVRVSNELGDNRPKSAAFSVVVTVTTSLFFGIVFMIATLAARKKLPRLFTDVPELVHEASKLAYLLAATIILDSIQPVLSGVAIGSGWQAMVAYINIGCYYFLGLPLGAILGFKFKLMAMGIWSGMLGGCLLQTIILIVITIRTDWAKEASKAEERIRKWGGQSRAQSIALEMMDSQSP